MQQALCEWVASAKSEAGVQLKHQQVVLAAFDNRPQKVCQTHGMPCTVQASKQANKQRVRKEIHKEEVDNGCAAQLHPPAGCVAVVVESSDMN